VDFKNVIMIMTTNVGSSATAHGTSFGLRPISDDTSYEKMKENLMGELQRAFRPEFLGRLDEVVVFRKLTREELKEIVHIELGKVRSRLRERGIALELTDEAKGFLIDKGDEKGNLDYGARPLRRSVERYVEDPLAEELLKGAFEGQNKITLQVKEVGGQKQLEFVGSTEPEGEVVAVGSGEQSANQGGIGLCICPFSPGEKVAEGRMRGTMKTER
jgi:ATP-dependent Clp protease ATP-binding subunit ClpC